MAKTKISEFDSNPANNTDIDGINLAEGMAPGLVNNAIRELMAQLKDFQQGSASDNVTVGGNLSVTGTTTLTGAATLGGNAVDALPSGTKMLFQQTAAPTGWTKDATHDNKALRVVSGTAGTGGSIAFTTAFGSQNVGATALTEAQMPSHTHSVSGTAASNGSHSHGISDPGHSHTYSIGFGENSFSSASRPARAENNTQTAVGSTGGAGTGISVNSAGAHTHSVTGTAAATGSGATHTHTLDLSVSYVDVIICTKN